MKAEYTKTTDQPALHHREVDTEGNIETETAKDTDHRAMKAPGEVGAVAIEVGAVAIEVVAEASGENAHLTVEALLAEK